jgi:hypothetical protein
MFIRAEGRGWGNLGFWLTVSVHYHVHKSVFRHILNYFTPILQLNTALTLTRTHTQTSQIKAFNTARRKSNNMSHFYINPRSWPRAAPAIQTKARELDRIQWNSSNVGGIPIIYRPNRSGTWIPRGAFLSLPLNPYPLGKSARQYHFHAERGVCCLLVIWHQSEHPVNMTTWESTMLFFWVVTPWGLVGRNKLSPSFDLKTVKNADNFLVKSRFLP